MASTTQTRWNTRRSNVSILHHAHTGVWLGIHQPDEGSTDVTVAHPKADDHCIDWFMNGPPSRIPVELPDQADDQAQAAIDAALEAMEAARPSGDDV